MPKAAQAAMKLEKVLANKNTRRSARRRRSRYCDPTPAGCGWSDNPLVVGFLSMLWILALHKVWIRG